MGCRWFRCNQLCRLAGECHGRLGCRDGGSRGRFGSTCLREPGSDKHCIRCHCPADAQGKVDLTGTPAGAFTVSYNFDDAHEPEIRRAIVHELLHIAFRHVGAVTVGLGDTVARVWLTQTIEEDTEALAEALTKVWP